jgi:hypothetical protein
MNQRIDELAEQCYVKTGSPHTDHFAYWKFAEMILGECLDICQRGTSTQTTGDGVATLIKLHFGIKND